MKRKIMILGAGLHQVRAIRKAVDLGYHVITLDYLPDNVGHRFSHAYENVSTVDVEGVLEAALRLRIDGICTFSSDVALPAVGHVCDRMGLPGISRAVAETLSDKTRFRSFMARHGKRTPRFVSGKSDDELYEGMNALRLPAMVKPVDSSGSRGVTKLETNDPELAVAAFRKARGFSRSGTVCMEEFLDGTEVGGDGILEDGRFAFVAVTQKYLRNFIVTGHRLPTGISERGRALVVDVLEDCCRSVGYRNGPVNFDVVVGDSHATIIEVSGRTGGNGIPAVILRAAGVDVEEATLKAAMGEKVALNNRGKISRGCGSIVFGSAEAGVLDRIGTLETLRRRVPEVLELDLALRGGQAVEAFDHSGCMIGYAVFDCADDGEYAMLSRRILETLNISVRKR